jgi:hypothetical protein
MTDRSRVMTQTKRGKFLQVGGSAVMVTKYLGKKVVFEMSNNLCRLHKCVESPRKIYKDYDFYIATWDVLSA